MCDWWSSLKTNDKVGVPCVGLDLDIINILSSVSNDVKVLPFFCIRLSMFWALDADMVFELKGILNKRGNSFTKNKTNMVKSYV